MNKKILGLKNLIDAVGAGCYDPTAKGPVVVRLELWDDRVVTASYYRREEGETPDIDCQDEIIWDDATIRPFAENLINEGKSFVTETGTSDTVCTLKWELQS